MRPFVYVIEEAPEKLQLESIDLQASTELKRLFRSSNKL